MSAPAAQSGTLYRAPMRFERDFTQLPNQWLRDERLSRGARGLLSELMTHSVGFSLSVEGLAQRGTEGRDAVRRMVRELETFGYLTRAKQKRGDGSRFGVTDWILSDPWDALVPPPAVDGFSVNGKADDGFPDDGSPDDGKPASKNTKPRTDKDQDFPKQPQSDREPVDNSPQPIWASQICPAAWKGDRRHILGPKSGKCTECAAEPLRWAS